MKITGPITMLDLRRMISKADRMWYMRQSQHQRKQYAAAFKDFQERKEAGSPDLNLIQFSLLFQLIEESLDFDHKSRTMELLGAMLDVMSIKRVDAGDGVVGLVKLNLSQIVYDPSQPSIKPIGQEDQEEGDDELEY